MVDTQTGTTLVYRPLPPRIFRDWSDLPGPGPGPDLVPAAAAAAGAAATADTGDTMFSDRKVQSQHRDALSLEEGQGMMAGATSAEHQQNQNQYQSQQYLESLVSTDGVVRAWRGLLEPDSRLLIRTFPEVEAMAHAKDYKGAIAALQSIVGSFTTFSEDEVRGYDGATYDLTRALLELGSLYFATGQVIFVTVLIARISSSRT